MRDSVSVPFEFFREDSGVFGNELLIGLVGGSEEGVLVGGLIRSGLFCPVVKVVEELAVSW